MIEFLKRKVERAIGDKFVEWLNRGTGSELQFERTGANPPDLVYCDGDKIMPIEVTTSYYNEEDAIMRWKLARKDRSVSTKEEPLAEPDQRLIADINQRIVAKCLGTHDVGTLLVIGIYPAMTTSTEFEGLKSSIVIPSSIPFAAIYVAGTFGWSRDGPGGYFCWKVG